MELDGYTSVLWLYNVPAWNSVARMPNLDPDIPMLILSAGRDRMISPHHQREMMDASKANDKYLLFAADAGHNSLREPIKAHPNEHAAWLEACGNMVAVV